MGDVCDATQEHSGCPPRRFARCNDALHCFHHHGIVRGFSGISDSQVGAADEQCVDALYRRDGIDIVDAFDILNLRDDDDIFWSI